VGAVFRVESVARLALTGIPLSYRKRPELGSEEVRFQPADHCDMLLSSMWRVGTPRMR
jgi:hypothetical protein